MTIVEELMGFSRTTKILIKILACLCLSLPIGLAFKQNICVWRYARERSNEDSNSTPSMN